MSETATINLFIHLDERFHHKILDRQMSKSIFAENFPIDKTNIGQQFNIAGKDGDIIETAIIKNVEPFNYSGHPISVNEKELKLFDQETRTFVEELGFEDLYEMATFIAFKFQTGLGKPFIGKIITWELSA